MRASRKSCWAANPSASAFTLVELLVVIGIIALLISILLPALSKARSSANLVKCSANMHSIGLAIDMYTVDFKGNLPMGYWDGNPIGSAAANYNGNLATDWSILLVAELVHGAGTSFSTSASTGANASSIRQALFCPDAPAGATIDPSGYFNAVHYGCHPRLMPSVIAGSSVDPISNALLIPYKVSHIQNNASIGLIFETSLVLTPNPNGGSVSCWVPNGTIPVMSGMDGGAINPTNDPACLTNSPSLLPSTTPMSSPVDITLKVTRTAWNKDTANNPNNIRFRHMSNTASNILFVDGHVQTFHWNPFTKLTDLPRSDIYVNP